MENIVGAANIFSIQRDAPVVTGLIQIKAPPVVVFDILNNVAEYPEWNEVVRSIIKMRKKRFLERTRGLGTLTGKMLTSIPYQKIRLGFEGGLLGEIKFRLTRFGCEVQVAATFKMPIQKTENIVINEVNALLESLKDRAEGMMQKTSVLQEIHLYAPSYWQECSI